MQLRSEEGELSHLAVERSWSKPIMTVLVENTHKKITFKKKLNVKCRVTKVRTDETDIVENLKCCSDNVCFFFAVVELVALLFHDAAVSVRDVSCDVCLLHPSISCASRERTRDRWLHCGATGMSLLLPSSRCFSYISCMDVWVKHGKHTVIPIHSLHAWNTGRSHTH